MGTLTKYELTPFGCEIFFETGTGTGSSLLHALYFGKFRQLFSSEIHAESAAEAIKRVGYRRNVRILHGSSASALEEILPKLDPQAPVLFFLDAHFPGEFFKNFSGYDVTPNLDIQLPLEHELKLIKKYRSDASDIIIVDDLRLYEDADYENGNLPKGYANIPESLRSIKFCEEIFPERILDRSLQDEGYLFISRTGISKMPPLSAHNRFKRQLLRLTGRI
jgi:hypothetical protein